MANLVAGEWLTEGDGTVNVVLDKYHGTELARLPNATNEQLDRAIGSAVAGMKALQQLDAGRRSAMLEDLARRIEAKSEEFARIIVQEAGKPIGYAKGEVARAITTVRVASMEALRFGGEVTPIDFGGGAGKTAFTKRVPIGVLAAITPFNFPLNLVLHKVAPAMAVGCPVVLKPASATPLSSLLLARLIQDIGWPAEAFHVLVCGREAAENLVKDERVAMMSFTGSDQVGWRLKAVCGKKKVALELGGNAAVIIDEGTDLASAAKAVAMGANLYAGQTCISTQRIFVVQGAFEAFRDLLVKEFQALKAGDPADPAVSVGPIIDAKHFQRIGQWCEEAVQGGAQVLTGGKAVDAGRNVYAATLLTHTDPTMKVDRDEVFGPLTLIEPVQDFSEALQRVNNSRFGLQAGVFTERFAHVKQAHAELEVGGVIINGTPGFRIDSMPYGGIKDSGLGREGVKYAMEEMSEPRLLVY
jgi:acyl-CoA reductase-like NAD-dependent aldehyde dehydrogenase